MPEALAIGVDYVLFWSLNPKRLEPFIEAFKQKMKLRQEEMNVQTWMTGMYVTHAIASCFGKNHQYPNSPISLGDIDAKEKSRNDALAFEALAITFNQQYTKEHTPNT